MPNVTTHIFVLYHQLLDYIYFPHNVMIQIYQVMSFQVIHQK